MKEEDVSVKIVKIKVCEFHKKLEACTVKDLLKGGVVDLSCFNCTLLCAFREVGIENLAQVAKIGNVDIIPTCCDERGLQERKNAS